MTADPAPTPEQVADRIVKELFPKQPRVNGVYPCIRPFVLAGMEHERRAADARPAEAPAQVDPIAETAKYLSARGWLPNKTQPAEAPAQGAEPDPRDARIAEMEEVLRPFARAADIFEREHGARANLEVGCKIKFSDLAEARRALGEAAHG